MTNIVVLIKQVPDYTERELSDGDNTIDRENTTAIIDEISSQAVETALQIKDAAGDGKVTVFTVGPAGAKDALQKALAMGADEAVLLSDDAIAGSDVVQTSWAIANVLSGLEGTELVIAGNEASDGRSGSVPAIIAEYLGLPQLTHLSSVTVEGGNVKGKRELDDGVYEVESALPAVISVNEKVGEARFPSFKGIMAAKKKPLNEMALGDTNIEAGQVGLDNASTKVVSAAPKPPREAGEKIEDEGEGGKQIAEYLVSQKII
ncbi:electron transfer flavoprotein subunit beta/FixA family protein [Dietzia sp.]|uniref:electron transfer flavoprotein subunit beta/FixA family protein n=1 Tax=Dietzia sp. TaxID=1871616 RepID=UPI002FD8FE23